MDQGIIELNAHTESRACQSAIDRMAAAFQERSSDLPMLTAPLYDLVDASSEDAFVFASSGVEAVCNAIWSVFSEISRKEGKTQFITSCLEDAPTLQMLKRCEELGCLVKIAPVDGHGRIDVEKLSSLITPRTALISVTMAQGLTGVIQPFEEIARLAQEKKVLLHLDASYAVGKIYFSFSGMSADYLSFAGERIHSVKSSGALFAKKGRPLVSYLPKGGALDVPSLAALSSAARLASLSLDAMGLEGARLRDLFETEIQKQIPDVLLLYKETPRLPNTTALFFPRAHYEALHYFSCRKGLFPNLGGTTSPHLHSIIAASGIEGECALSFSLSRMTSQEEVLRAARLVAEEVQELRKLSEDLF
jgi:cysteine desulfurase